MATCMQQLGEAALEAEVEARRRQVVLVDTACGRASMADKHPEQDLLFKTDSYGRGRSIKYTYQAERLKIS